MRSLVISARLFALPGPGAFALPRRGAVKLWTNAAERLLIAALNALPSPGVGAQGLAEISLKLDQDGSLTRVRLQRSSGVEALDAACLGALASLSPLPAPPSPVVESEIVVLLEFVLRRESAA